MTIDELDKYLKTYTIDELFYKDYYLAKKDPANLKDFIDNVDVALIKEKSLIVPDIDDVDIMEPYLLIEDYVFESKKDYNILASKHFRYTPEFTHKHAFFEMIYVHSGKCEQNIMGDKILLNEGDICIVPPDVEHSISVFDDSVVINVIIRSTTFNDTFLEVLSEENILSSFFTKILYTKNYNNYIIFRTNNSDSIRNFMGNIIIESIENQQYSNKILDNFLMILFAHLLRDKKHTVELPQELQKSNRQLTSILTYIQGNYKTVSLEDLSKEFHFTVPYLSKLIKANTGHTFKEMIQTIKLNKAIELLTSSDLKIRDVSDLIGYEDDNHFIRTFKKVYGVSPNQYRKKIMD
ncbi:AraC family transcriptional regulator [Clostridium sp. C8-1-8]|uniref:AraC family transcriptional regulator n=1 Tax=Clostridium sp. C8-1-8 TaxID=2698831 RepID=UPI00136B28DE|nr:AraC family transcriptional regulator [Clostridium sp. C8-1-8]